MSSLFCINIFSYLFKCCRKTNTIPTEKTNLTYHTNENVDEFDEIRLD